MIRSASRSILASVIVVGAAACAGEQQQQAPTEVPKTTAGTIEQPTTTVEGAVSTGDVFATLRAIHSSEMEHAKLALMKAQDPRVKAFADEVVKEHTAQSLNDEQLMSRMNVQPRPNAISAQISGDASDQTSRLNTVQGADFDRAYIQEQIRYYRMLLGVLDDKLIPNVRDPQVRNDLVEERARANHRLTQAEDVRLAMAGPVPPG